MTDGGRLAELLARRMCHDFAGPTGAISTVLDMADGGAGDAELAALVGDAARALEATLTLTRFVVTGGAAGGGAARGLVAAWLATRDAPVLVWTDVGHWSDEVAPLVAGLVMLAGEGARRGTLTVGREGVQVDAAVTFPAALAAVLAGAQATTPQLALAELLALRAAVAGLALRLTLDASGATFGVYQASELPN